VISWFEGDDATFANLEGPLTDEGGPVVKKHTFRGPESYVNILTQNSVEFVSLANNHTLDFGLRGYQDTCRALEEARIGYVCGENVLVAEKGGYRIGFTASAFTLSPADERRLAAQMGVLRELGCLAVIHVMHAGVEYAPAHSPQQQAVAETAIGLGADLVVGHHPHVPQDAALHGGVPVIYSLGNCCFGGNLNPTERDGLLLQVRITFAGGERAGLDWTLHPIRTTGGESGNDYCPQLLQGPEAQRVIQRITGPGGLRFVPDESGGYRPAE
jgi:poly-gamma-glutamate synthesis protein (capsule biosynthesis protein)